MFFPMNRWDYFCNRDILCHEALPYLDRRERDDRRVLASGLHLYHDDGGMLVGHGIPHHAPDVLPVLDNYRVQAAAPADLLELDPCGDGGLVLRGAVAAVVYDDQDQVPGVVECDGRVVFVAYADVQRPEGWLIQGVYTWPEFRRRGFAAIGVSDLCREAMAAGASHVQLAVVEGNAAGQGLYAGLGFEPFGELRTILFSQA